MALRAVAVALGAALASASGVRSFRGLPAFPRKLQDTSSTPEPWSDNATTTAYPETEVFDMFDMGVFFPLDCGLNATCYNWAGNVTCGDANGCACDPAHEWSCKDSNNQTQCYSKDWNSGCPVECTGDDMTCSITSFDMAGTATYASACAAPDDTTGWCPTLCDEATADECEDWFGSFCAPKGKCPTAPEPLPEAPECEDGQQLCFGQNASTVGTPMDVGTCLSVSSCPCPVGEQPCVDSWGLTFCLDKSFSCPLNCGDLTVNQTCTVLSFQDDGSLDFSSLTNQVCAPVDTPCPCGANALLCNYTDSYGFQNVYCQAAKFNGIPLTCPITCTQDQQECFTVNFDQFGNYTGYDQSCADLNAVCPCGKNTVACKDEFGSQYCLPSKDSYGNNQSCPVVCDAVTQDTCNLPVYNKAGSLVNVETKCVASGSPCPCSSTAVPCNSTLPDGSIFTDCLPPGSFCAKPCPLGQVACPLINYYSPEGLFLSTQAPAAADRCADSLDMCSCGEPKANAQKCTDKLTNQTYCLPQPKDGSVKCPKTCAENEQLCYIQNYNATGFLQNEVQECTNANSTCDCGTNAVRLPGSSSCVSKVQAAQISTCDASQEVCWVEKFNSEGVTISKDSSCVPKGSPCSCDSSARSCPDPNDATQNFCVPKSSKDGSTSCPTPCTKDQELKGLATCVQTNLDKSGKYVSTNIFCVNASACEPGTNQKVCPSGARVFTGSPCQDIYGVVGNSSDLGLPAGTTQESTLVISLDAGPNVSASSLGAAANNVQASLISVLQLPNGVQADVSLAGVSAGGRRLGASSTVAVKKVQVVVSVKSTGKTKVAPSAIAAKAKTMATSGQSSFKTAFSAVGTPNAKAGVSASTKTSATVSRATTAQASRNTAAASATTQSPTTAGTTTTAATQAGTSTAKAGAATSTTVAQAPSKGSAGSANSGLRAQPMAASLFAILAIAGKLL